MLNHVPAIRQPQVTARATMTPVQERREPESVEPAESYTPCKKMANALKALNSGPALKLPAGATQLVLAQSGIFGLALEMGSYVSLLRQTPPPEQVEWKLPQEGWNLAR